MSADRRRLRLYRLLLRLFPARFRRTRGAEMEQLFLSMTAERLASQRRMGARFWLRLFWDTASQALMERLAPPRAPSSLRPRLHLGDRMSTLVSDARYAVRTVLRQPMHGLMIVVMMALAIAGNAAVFRIFNGLFLRPLPFERAEELVDLDETAPQWNLEFVGISYTDFAAWRRENRTFAAMAAFSETGANFADGDEAIRIDVIETSYDLAAVLGLQPTLGRFFTAEEDHSSAPRVALLTRGFWEQQYGADPQVLGRTVSLNGHSHEIIGVLPAAADFVGDVQVWMPLRLDDDGSWGWYLTGLGRLAPGVTPAQAREDLLNIHRGMIEQRSVNEITSPVVNAVRDRYLGEYRLGSSVLFGAVGIVLLIACANIAGLMLARSLARTREIGIRMAMGAGRTRIARQLLTESLLLSAAGAAIGTGLGVWGSAALVAKMAEQFPRWVSFGLDWRFVVFTLALTVGAAVVFGLLPAIQAAGVDTRGILDSSTARSTISLGKRRVLNVVVAGEVGLALVLLIVAGLRVIDLRQLQRIDPGYRTDDVLSYRLSLPSAKYENNERRVAFYEQHVERLRTLPGVVNAAAASNLPLAGHLGFFFEVEGAPPRNPEDPNPVVLNRAVTSGYFETMGVTLKTGRPFNDFDGRENGSHVAIVNETFVRHFFPDGSDPMGRRIGHGGDSPWKTIVGVAHDVKHYGVDREMRPGVYQPVRQLPRTSLYVAVRTANDPATMMSAVRQVLRQQDPELPLYDAQSMRERLDDSLWTRRATSWLIAAFSSVALLLAVAGIYGVISYGVGQRAHEISIRMALGARNGQVVRQVMGQGMVLVVAGVVAGLVTTVGIANLISSMLVGVSATDVRIYGAVTAMLVAVAALANFVPAWRAAGTAPMGALRGE